MSRGAKAGVPHYRRAGRPAKTAKGVRFHEAMGRRMRSARLGLGMTLGQVAKSIGVSYQQIHKFETGKNAISCAHLIQFSQLTKMPIESFLIDGADLPAIDNPELQASMRIAAKFQALSGRERAVIEMLIDKLAGTLPGDA